jgi:hypothetical protein
MLQKREQAPECESNEEGEKTYLEGVAVWGAIQNGCIKGRSW